MQCDWKLLSERGCSGPTCVAMSKEIRFNAFAMNCVGHMAPGLWRHPRDRSDRYIELSYWIELVRLLERGKFDGLFLADVLGPYDVYQGRPDAAIHGGIQIPVNDPLLLVPGMAAATENLGLGVTCALTYKHPYSFARRASTLDHLTKGRFAWNIVSGYLDSAARNFGLDQQIQHDDRYDFAEEYMEVCYKLWERSWPRGRGDSNAMLSVCGAVPRIRSTTNDRIHEMFFLSFPQFL